MNKHLLLFFIAVSVFTFSFGQTKTLIGIVPFKPVNSPPWLKGQGKKEILLKMCNANLKYLNLLPG